MSFENPVVVSIAAFGLIVSIVLAFGVLAVYYTWKRARRLKEEYAELMATYMEARTTSPESLIGIANGLLGRAKEIPKESPTVLAAWLYSDALNLVSVDQRYRPFALAMGRAAYGLPRDQGVPTVYDEAAIKNDIEARVGGSR